MSQSNVRGAESRPWKQPGAIFEIARAARIEVPGSGAKRTIHCPFHDDQWPSAFLSDSNVFYCSVCTPGRGLGLKAFAQALGVAGPPRGRFEPSRAAPAPRTEAPAFTASDAARVWQMAYERVRNDATLAVDRPVYDYLAHRGILGAWEESAFGVLAECMDLPKAVAWWPGAGYRIVAPLYDATGRLSSIQARAIVPVRTKVQFPKGSRTAGTVFANRSGLEVLRGTWKGPRRVLLAEGLSDSLALSVVSLMPVVSAPGTGPAVHSIGPWASGYEVYLALDQDEAGRRALAPTARQAFEQRVERVFEVGWPGGCKDACEVVERRGMADLVRFLDAIAEGSHAGR